MSEIELVLAVEGAVDRAVLAKQADPAVVAAMLVPYRDESAPGWFDAFEAWTRERSGTPDDEPVLPSLEEALELMADSEPAGRERALRLLALTVLSRAVREFGPQGDRAGEVQAALRPLTPTGISDEVVALHELVCDTELYAGIEQWGEMVTRAGGAGVLEMSTASQTVPPCSAKLKMVLVGTQKVVDRKSTRLNSSHR